MIWLTHFVKQMIEKGLLNAVVMYPQIVIAEAPDTLEPYALLKNINLEGSGGIVSFVGMTRGKENEENVLHLEFDAWKEELPKTLHKLAIEASEAYNLNFVIISHRVGKVYPEEPIVAIHVGAKHRKEAFKSCEWLIDSLKNQAPLWKKEVRENSIEWKGGLG